MTFLKKIKAIACLLKIKVIENILAFYLSFESQRYRELFKRNSKLTKSFLVVIKVINRESKLSIDSLQKTILLLTFLKKVKVIANQSYGVLFLRNSKLPDPLILYYKLFFCRKSKLSILFYIRQKTFVVIEKFWIHKILVIDDPFIKYTIL